MLKFAVGVVLVLGFSVYEGYALQCWACSSDIDRTCADRFNATDFYRFGSGLYQPGYQAGYSQQPPYDPYNSRTYDSNRDRSSTYRNENNPPTTEPYPNYRESYNRDEHRYPDDRDRDRNRDPYFRDNDRRYDDRDFNRRDYNRTYNRDGDHLRGYNDNDRHNNSDYKGGYHDRDGYNRYNNTDYKGGYNDRDGYRYNNTDYRGGYYDRDGYNRHNNTDYRNRDFYSRNDTNSTNRDYYNDRDKYNQHSRDRDNDRNRDPNRDRYYDNRGDYNNRDPNNRYPSYREPSDRDPNSRDFDRDRDYRNRDYRDPNYRDPYFDSRDRARDPYNNRDRDSISRDGGSRDPYDRDLREPYNRDNNRDYPPTRDYGRDGYNQQGRGYDSRYPPPARDYYQGAQAQAQIAASQSGPRLVTCNEEEARLRRMRNVCVKKVQRVGEFQVTYIRRCEMIPFEKEVGTCYDPVARGISLDFCEYCEYDGCNSATGLKFNIFLASFVPLVLAWACFW